MPNFAAPTTFQPYQRRKPMGAQPGMQQPGQPRYQRGAPAPGAPLQAPAPMTQAGGIAQQRITQGLQTGQFGEVQAAQTATDRASALRTTQALQAARGSATRGSLSAEAAQRAQDEAMAAANATNLEAQNSVNQLQRQAGQDAMTRAGQMETEAYGRASDERSFQTGRMDLGYDRATDESRYGDTRDDVMYGRGRQEKLDNRDDSRYADSRDDVKYNRGYQEKRDTIGDERYDKNYADNREDINYNRGYQEKRDTIGDERYGDETRYSRGRDALGDERYDRTYADNRDDVKYNRGEDTRRWDLNRGDTLDETQYRRGRDTVGDQRYESETNYAHGRDSIGDERYNNETTYARGRDAIGDERYNSETTYARGRDALGDTRYDRTYADNRGDINYSRDESKRLEGKGDVESLISSVTDPRAQNILRATQAKGGDVKAMYESMMDNGTIKKEFRGASPGQEDYQAAADKLKAMYPEKSDEEIQSMVRSDYETERAPIQDAALERSVNTKLSNGSQLTPDEKAYGVKAGLVNTFTAKTLPKGSNVGELKGQQVNLDGKVYTVVGGGKVRNSNSSIMGYRHTDYTILEQGGKRLYAMPDGTIKDTEPKNAR